MKDELAKYYEITECCCSTDTHPSTTEKCWNPHCMWATASVQMQPNDAFTERLQGWADSVDDLLAQVASATSELGASSKRLKTATKDKTGADYVAPLKSVAAGSSGGTGSRRQKRKGAPDRDANLVLRLLDPPQREAPGVDASVSELVQYHCLSCHGKGWMVLTMDQLDTLVNSYAPTVFQDAVSVIVRGAIDTIMSSTSAVMTGPHGDQSLTMSEKLASRDDRLYPVLFRDRKWSQKEQESLVSSVWPTALGPVVNVQKMPKIMPKPFEPLVRCSLCRLIWCAVLETGFGMFMYTCCVGWVGAACPCTLTPTHH